jgi:LPXTG-motif cell wall-anchored protein
MQRDLCEAKLWPAIREQFGVPDALTPDAPAPHEDPGGCCDTRGSAAGAAGAAGLAALVAGLLVRRRRRA